MTTFFSHITKKSNKVTKKSNKVKGRLSEML